MSGTSIDFKVKYIKEERWDIISCCYKVMGDNIRNGFPDANHILVAQKLADLVPLIKSLDISNVCCYDRLRISYDNNTENVSMNIIKHEKNQCH